jgi:hypothetical protein
MCLVSRNGHVMSFLGSLVIDCESEFMLPATCGIVGFGYAAQSANTGFQSQALPQTSRTVARGRVKLNTKYKQPTCLTPSLPSSLKISTQARYSLPKNQGFHDSSAKRRYLDPSSRIKVTSAAFLSIAGSNPP